MGFKYAIVDLDMYVVHELSSQIDLLGNYERVDTQYPINLLDIIIAGTPDLIFINVDDYTEKAFNDLSGIITDLYRSFVQKPFLVALATTPNKAYNCIKNSFFYYLIKPIDRIELRKLDNKLRLTSTPITCKKKLCLKKYNDYRFIEIDEILYLKSENNSTKFHMIDNTQIISFKTLKHFEAVLPNFFCRIHQSFIINENYISRINLGNSECHLKPFQIKLPFSKTYQIVMTEQAAYLLSKSLS